MRKLILIILFVLAFPLQQSAYGADWIYQWYVPTFWGFASGGGGAFHQFADVVDDRLLLPFEFKIVTKKFSKLALTTNGIISYYQEYREGDEFGSLNLSVGLGLSPVVENKSPLQGFFFSVYPAYEIPVLFSFNGEAPVCKWKSAMDIGMGFNFLSITDIYISVYARLIGFWRDSFTEFGSIPDFGITIGWHFKDKMFGSRSDSTKS